MRLSFNFDSSFNCVHWSSQVDAQIKCAATNGGSCIERPTCWIMLAGSTLLDVLLVAIRATSAREFVIKRQRQ